MDRHKPASLQGPGHPSFPELSPAAGQRHSCPCSVGYSHIDRSIRNPPDRSDISQNARIRIAVDLRDPINHRLCRILHLPLESIGRFLLLSLSRGRRWYPDSGSSQSNRKTARGAHPEVSPRLLHRLVVSRALLQPSPSGLEPTQQYCDCPRALFRSCSSTRQLSALHHHGAAV